MQTILAPLQYFKLKARVLELMLNEREILAQKQAAFAEVGMPAGQYLFEDATTSVTVLIPQSQVAAAEAAAAGAPPPPSEPPPPAPAPAPLTLVPDPAPDPPDVVDPPTEL